MIWKEVWVGGVEYVLRIGEDVLELDGKGGARVEITENWHNRLVVCVFSYELLVFADENFFSIKFLV